MSSRWLFPPGMPGDGAAHGLVAVLTVVEVPAGMVDGPVPDAVRDPRRVVGRPGQQPVAVRSDEVIPGLRVITDRMGTTVVGARRRRGRPPPCGRFGCGAAGRGGRPPVRPAGRCSLRALRVTGLDVLFAITSTLAAATRPDMSPEWTVRTRPLT